MYKLTKKILRLWITVSSVSAFLFGWVVLAHAPKPSSLITTPAAVVQQSLAPLDPLAPLPALDQLQDPSSSTLIQQGNLSTNIDIPRLRTSGS
jgi:hypothetical protein